MRIERAELFEFPLRLREPFETHAGVMQNRPVLLVALHADGQVGWGECTALEAPSYSPETTETAWHILTRWLLPGVVGRAELRSGGRAFGCAQEVLASVRWLRGHPMAKAAVETAAWDLEAKLAGVPLCEAVGGMRRAVPAGVSIGLQPSADALVQRIDAFLADGYRRVKVKITPESDVVMLREVRARFPDLAVTADANSAYSLDDLSHLRELDELGLAMIEQPLACDDLLGHARLQAELQTPLCLDESIGSARDAHLALELGACRIVNVKPGRVGGLTEARAIHDLCRERGVPVWCGGMLESGIGRAHAVALATLPGFTTPSDLSASRRYWERDLVDPEWTLEDGALAPLAAAGIGVEPDRSRIEALAVRRENFG